jgi:hypothetical protein
MKKHTYKIAAIATLSVLAVVGFTKTWSPSSNPALLGANMVRNFYKLPLTANLQGPRQPWSDTYWPHYEGGIAVPYRTGEDAWKSRLFSKTEILSGRVSAEQINNLSPAAKFDLLRGMYNYPLTRDVLSSTNPKNPSWWGICHGWAPAALNHPEPQPITVTNPDGVVIHFGSSDVKALISFYYADYAYKARKVRQLGNRCNGDGFLFFRPGNCKRDVNPGALHIVLGNLIGLQRRGLVGDVTQSKEVWNQPISGYESTVVRERAPSNRSARGTAKEVLVRTKMNYVVEIGPQELPVVGTDSQSFDSRDFTYWLELDAAGNILGGSYNKAVSEESPDFFWTVQPMAFLGDFAALNKIYLPAR